MIEQIVTSYRKIFIDAITFHTLHFVRIIY